jgi:hypothetical protein
MLETDFDPIRIRKCQLLTSDDGIQMIQFIATGDKHQMMKQDDGSIQMVKLAEQGKDYKYHDPKSLNDALYILDKGTFPTHQDIANQIRGDLNLS